MVSRTFCKSWVVVLAAGLQEEGKSIQIKFLFCSEQKAAFCKMEAGQCNQVAS